MLTLKNIIEMLYLKLSITPLGMDPPPPCSSLSFLHQCSISARDTLPFLSSSNTSNRVLMAVTNLGGRPSKARDCEDLSFILPCPVIIQTPDQEHWRQRQFDFCWWPLPQAGTQLWQIGQVYPQESPRRPGPWNLLTCTECRTTISETLILFQTKWLLLLSLDTMKHFASRNLCESWFKFNHFQLKLLRSSFCDIHYIKTSVTKWTFYVISAHPLPSVINTKMARKLPITNISWNVTTQMGVVMWKVILPWKSI